MLLFQVCCIDWQCVVANWFVPDSLSGVAYFTGVCFSYMGGGGGGGKPPDEGYAFLCAS